MSVTINADFEMEIDELLRQANDPHEVMEFARDNYSANIVMNILGYDIEEVLGEWDEAEVLAWVRKRWTTEQISSELDIEPERQPATVLNVNTMISNISQTGRREVLIFLLQMILLNETKGASDE